MTDKKAPEVISEQARESLAPFIVTRAGSGLIDLFIVAALTALLALAGLSMIVNPALQQSREFYMNSGLYGENMTALELEGEQYDEVLTVFYSSNTRAVRENRLQEYLKAKADSGLFDTDGNVNSDADAGEVKEFYSQQYELAIRYLDEDPEIRALAQKGMLQVRVIIMICFLLLSIAFYLIIPLKTMRHVTLGQMVNKIKPVDYATLKEITGKQVVLRWVVFVTLYFYVPFTFAQMNGTAAIGILAALVVFNITFRNQRGIHEVLSSTMMIDIRKETGGYGE